MQNRIKNLLNERDRFAKNNGIKLLEVKENEAVAQMKIEEKHLNGADVVQGGAIFTLADFALGAASNSEGILHLSITSTITFMKPVKTGTLTANAKLVSKSSKIATYIVEVVNEKKELIALMQGTVYNKQRLVFQKT